MGSEVVALVDAVWRSDCARGRYDTSHITRRHQISRQGHPKGEHDHAATIIAQAAEGQDLAMHARIATLQAINRRKERMFTDRKDRHWGKRKLKRDQWPFFYVDNDCEEKHSQRWILRKMPFQCRIA